MDAVRIPDAGGGSNKQPEAIGAFHFLAALPQRHPAGMRRPLGLPYRSGDVGHRPEVGRKFVVADLRLTLNPLFRKLGIERAVNLYPELCKAFFTFMLPARDVRFRLRAVK